MQKISLSISEKIKKTASAQLWLADNAVTS